MRLTHPLVAALLAGVAHAHANAQQAGIVRDGALAFVAAVASAVGHVAAGPRAVGFRAADATLAAGAWAPEIAP